MVSFYFPLAASISSIFIVFIIRFLDVIEKEAWKYVFLSFIAGCLGYAASVISVAEVLRLWPASIDNIFLNSISAFSFSTVLLFAFQLISCLIFYYFYNKQFETLTDYILYSVVIGIGFSVSESLMSLVLSLGKFQGLASTLYFSPFGYGQSIPLLFAAYGAILFLITYRYRFNIKPVLLASILLLLSFTAQIMYSFAIYIINFTSPHIVTPFTDISAGLFLLVSNISTILILGLIGLSVLHDFYILQIFTDKLCEKLDPLMKQKIDILLVDIRNPFFYILSSSKLLWRLFRCRSKTTLSQKVFGSYSRYALEAWVLPSATELNLNKALKILTMSE